MRLVTKALSFAALRVAVYSTCSVHRIENEDVVARVLEATGGAWQLVECLPDWPTRGLADAPGGKLCVRAGPADLTHGFFVARFERRAEPAAAHPSSRPAKKRRTQSGSTAA